MSLFRNPAAGEDECQAHCLGLSRTHVTAWLDGAFELCCLQILLPNHPLPRCVTSLCISLRRSIFQENRASLAKSNRKPSSRRSIRSRIQVVVLEKCALENVAPRKAIVEEQLSLIDSSDEHPVCAGSYRKPSTRNPKPRSCNLLPEMRSPKFLQGLSPTRQARKVPSFALPGRFGVAQLRRPQGEPFQPAPERQSHFPVFYPGWPALCCAGCLHFLPAAPAFQKSSTIDPGLPKLKRGLFRAFASRLAAIWQTSGLLLNLRS